MRHKKFSNVGNDLTLKVPYLYKTNRKVTMIAIHCSTSPQGRGDDAKTIDRWHKQNKGWGGIGYHYVVLEDGTIQKGRWVDNRPIHAKGYNKGAIAICRIGGVKKVEGKLVPTFDATAAQLDSIRLLVRKLGSYYMNDIVMHDEISNKGCPMLTYSQKSYVRN